MAFIALQRDFRQSCEHYKAYPTNLPRAVALTYPASLQAYEKQLSDHASLLFTSEPLKYEVTFRDLGPLTFGNNGVRKTRAHSSKELAEFVGLEVLPDANNASRCTINAKRTDPPSRFIYIYAKHGRDRLKIFKDDLSLILTYHQVMPAFLDFISVFGAQDEPREARFSSFRHQIMLSDSQRGIEQLDLGRSGRKYQLCYNLKCVTLALDNITDMKQSQWSIRQAAINHQFDVETGNALWIVVKGRLDLEGRYKEMTDGDAPPENITFGTVSQRFRAALAPHLMFCHWATEDWRGYVRWLETVLETETSVAIYGNRVEDYAYRHYSPYDIQDLQRWEDNVNEAIVVMEANVKIIQNLRKFYGQLAADADFPDQVKQDCVADLIGFKGQLQTMIEDFEIQIARAKLCVKISADRKELVSKHLQSQATNRMEKLNTNMEKEAIVVRIITTVTLIYLPATFVSTFFSTDIIRYQDNGDLLGRGLFAPMAMWRWLQVTLPLTFITIATSFGWGYLARRAAVGKRLRHLGGRYGYTEKSIALPSDEEA